MSWGGWGTNPAVSNPWKGVPQARSLGGGNSVQPMLLAGSGQRMYGVPNQLAWYAAGGGAPSGGGYGLPLDPRVALAQAEADMLRNQLGFNLSGGGYGSSGRGGYGGGGGGLTADQQRQLINFDIWENALKMNEGYKIDQAKIEAQNRQLASQGRVIGLNQELIQRDLNSLGVDEGGINRAIALQRKLMGYDTQEFQNRASQNQLAIQGTQWESDLGLRQLGAEVGLGREKANFGLDLGMRRINWNEGESLRKLGSDAAARGAGTSSGYNRDITNTHTQAGFDREELQKGTGFTLRELSDRERFESERLRKGAEFKIKDIQLQQKILEIQHQASQATSLEQINKYQDDLKKLGIQRETLFLNAMKNNEQREMLAGDLLASAAQGQDAELQRLLGMTNEARLQYQLSLVQ